MSAKAATYAERTVIRLPAGTLDRVREQAERQRTSPAEVMRQAIVMTLERVAIRTEDEPVAAE